MIIKRLVLYNFGSYFKRTEILFPNNGFFLISGPTGSGKTTILEAISYAIFGRIPRYGDNEKILKFIVSKNEHNKHKKTNFVEVELDFSIANQYYGIVRKVEFSIEDGEEKTKRSEVILKKISSSNISTVSAKTKEYEREICKILGMENITKAYEAFTKSIFLPQNAFDRFLYLRSTERKNLIFELFNLTIYEKIKQKIVEEYNSLKVFIQNLNKEKEAKIEQINQHKQNIQTMDIEKLKNDQNNYKELFHKMLILKGMLKDDLFLKTNQMIEELKENFNVLIYLQDLENKEIFVNQLINDLDFNRSLCKVLNSKYLKFQEELSKVDLSYFRLLSLTRNNLPQKELFDFILKIKEINILEQKMYQTQEKIQNLEQRINNLGEVVGKVEIILQKLKKEEEEIEEEIDGLERKRESLKEKLEVKQNILHIQEFMLKQGTQKCLVCSCFMGQEEKKFIESSIQKGDTKIIQSIEEINEKMKELNERKKKIESEILKRSREQASSKSELEQKKEELKTLINEIEKFKVELLKTNQSIQTDFYKNVEKLLEEYYKQKLDLKKNLEKVELLFNQLFLIDNLFQKLIDYVNTNADFKISINHYSLNEELDKGINELNQKLENLEKFIKRFREKVINNDYESIQKILLNPNFEKNLKKLNEYPDFDKIYLLLKKEKQNIECFKELKQKFDKFSNMISLVINNTEQVIKSVIESKEILNDEIIGKLQNKINDLLQNDLQNVSNFGKNIKILKELHDEYAKFSDFLDNEINKTEQILEKVNESINTFDLVKRIEDELVSLEKRIREEEEKLKILEILRNDFEGGKRRDFLDFVFQTIFDMVTKKANQILNEITEGRYSIEFSEDIEIVDSWYGVRRTVKSLSGGEKFLTSLSIAMAISDLMSISKYQVKSMFIDEGFGTLDINTLNDVIDYLENYFYNNSDKVLGIITHVEEIKDRFNYVIKVNKGKDGSSVEIINRLER